MSFKGGILNAIQIRLFGFIACVMLVISGCNETDKAEKKVVEYVPDQNQSYVKVLSNKPADIPLLPQDTSPCYVDVINNQQAVGLNELTSRSKVHMSGWAGDVPNGKSPRDIWLELDGIKQNTGFYYIKTASGINRQDVADVFKKPGLVNVGWEVYADLSGLSGGIYEVHVVMLIDQYWMTCDTKRLIQL